MERRYLSLKKFPVILYIWCINRKPAINKILMSTETLYLCQVVQFSNIIKNGDRMVKQSYLAFFLWSRASNSDIISQIWSDFKFIQDFWIALIIYKYHEDPTMKTTLKPWVVFLCSSLCHAVQSLQDSVCHYIDLLHISSELSLLIHILI